MGYPNPEGAVCGSSKETERSLAMREAQRKAGGSSREATGEEGLRQCSCFIKVKYDEDKTGHWMASRRSRVSLQIRVSEK